MSGARPIPISNSRRSSPPGSTGSGRDLSMDAISHSLPAPVLTPGGGCAFPTSSAASAAAARYHPPRAPFFGSLPEPSFLQMDDDAMPELMLPPRLNERDESPPAASVVQVRPVGLLGVSFGHGLTLCLFRVLVCQLMPCGHWIPATEPHDAAILVSATSLKSCYCVRVIHTHHAVLVHPPLGLPLRVPWMSLICPAHRRSQSCRPCEMVARRPTSRSSVEPWAPAIVSFSASRAVRFRRMPSEWRVSRCRSQVARVSSDSRPWTGVIDVGRTGTCRIWTKARSLISRISSHSTLRTG